MLNAISWQQYLTAILLLSVAWYGYIGLRFYSKGITAKLRIKTAGKSQLPPVASHSISVMGALKADADAAVHPPDELIFGSSEPDDIEDQTLPPGPSDELLAEAKVLVTAYSDNDDKNEFLSLFKLLIGKYEVFSDEISLPAILGPLREYAEDPLPFSVKETEWPLTF